MSFQSTAPCFLTFCGSDLLSKFCFKCLKLLSNDYSPFCQFYCDSKILQHNRLFRIGSDQAVASVVYSVGVAKNCEYDLSDIF